MAHRMMPVTLGMMVLAAVVPAAPARLSAARADLPKAQEDQQTHPRMHPGKGTRKTAFAASFTLRRAPGHEGVVESEYAIKVDAPPNARAACASVPPAAITSGAAGERRRVALNQPKPGWCRGRYRVTVTLMTGPYCPPPEAGQRPAPCPKFASQILDAGRTRFSVRRKRRPA